MQVTLRIKRFNPESDEKAHFEEYQVEVEGTDVFIVDGKGVIRHQHVGNITPEDVPLLLSELEKAR